MNESSTQSLPFSESLCSALSPLCSNVFSAQPTEMKRITEGTKVNQESPAYRKPFDPSQMAVVRGDSIPDEWNALTSRVIGCAMTVHSALGPGLRESLYEEAMLHEMQLNGLHVAQQVGFRIVYKGREIGLQTIDLIVEDRVILELKSVVQVREVDSAQLVGYLRFTGLPLGLLINFHTPLLKDSIVRKINWPPAKTSSIQVARVHPPPTLPPLCI